MADTSGIDSVFDFIDNGIDQIDRVLNRHKHIDDKLKGAHDEPPPASEVKSAKPSTPSTPWPARHRFRLIESLDGETGETYFVVTNGIERTECNSRAMAEQIMRAMEPTP